MPDDDVFIQHNGTDRICFVFFSGSCPFVFCGRDPDAGEESSGEAVDEPHLVGRFVAQRDLSRVIGAGALEPHSHISFRFFTAGVSVFGNRVTKKREHRNENMHVHSAAIYAGRHLVYSSENKDITIQ